MGYENSINLLTYLHHLQSEKEPGLRAVKRASLFCYRPCRCGSYCECRMPQCKHRTIRRWQATVPHCPVTTIYHLKHIRYHILLNLRRVKAVHNSNKLSFALGLKTW